MSQTRQLYNIRSAVLKLPSNNTVYNAVILILISIMSTLLVLFLGTKDNGWFRRKLPGEKCDTENRCGFGLECRENPDPSNPGTRQCQLPIKKEVSDTKCQIFCPNCLAT